MQLALKIDVDTLRGTREGVPALLQIAAAPRCRCHVPVQPRARITPGARSGACFGPGFFGKVSRTSVLEHYGLKTLLYGTLLPGPDIGRARRGVDAQRARCGLRGRHSLLRSRQLAGFRRPARCRLDARSRCSGRCERFRRGLRQPRRALHGAAGWQMNERALRARRGARLRVRLGHARRSAVRAADARRRAQPLPAAADDAADARRADRPRRHRRRATCTGRLLALTREPRARPRVHAARRARGHEAAAGVRTPARTAGAQQGYELVSMRTLLPGCTIEQLPAAARADGHGAGPQRHAGGAGLGAARCGDNGGAAAGGFIIHGPVGASMMAT